MRMGSPMSSTKISPPLPMAPACMTSAHGLGDGHEEARHALVGDRDRAARGDLALEERHDAAARAEHVAEAHGHELRVGGFARHGLDDALGERASRAPMTRRRARRPCRSRSSTKPPGAEAHRRSRPAPCVAKLLLSKASAGLCLHHRHVLVGGGVKDDVGAPALEQRAQLGLVADVDEAGREVGEVALGLELVLDLEEVALGVVDQDEEARTHGGELAREFAADRAAGARDHDDLVGDVADGVVVEPDLVAAQDVFDLHLAELFDRHRALDELVDAGQRLDGHVGALAGQGDVFEQVARPPTASR